MSKLLVSPELLMSQLFENAPLRAEIVGASFDHARRVVVLQIEGPDVPDAEEVTAVCHRQAMRVELLPRK